LTTPEISKISDLTAEAQALAKDDLPPSRYLDLLEQHSLFRDAVRFLAHKLEVKKAIQWAHSVAQELQPPDEKQGEESLAAVGKWLQKSDDASRREAMHTAEKSGISSAGDCVAMAVFFSGGSITPPEAPETQPPPYFAQKMAADSIVLAVFSHDADRATERYKQALAMGRKLDAG
jgi:hypothetical protein